MRHGQRNLREPFSCGNEGGLGIVVIVVDSGVDSTGAGWRGSSGCGPCGHGHKRLVLVTTVS